MESDLNALPVPDLGLRCLECGYNLAGLPQHRCPECGRTFSFDEYIPKGEAPRVIFNAREVRLTPEIIELMHRKGIPIVADPSAWEKLIGMEIAGGGPKWLAVSRRFYFAAIDALRRYSQTGRLPPVSEPPKQASKKWRCSGCGELNPGSFEICWQCGRDGPEAV